jgi:NAD(P)H-hydrate epimerase
MTVRVVSASQAAELDRLAIDGGIPSRTLMQAAGRGAATLLLERYPLEAARGVAIFTGSGNNGGDAWVVAGELARRGVRVRVAEVVPAKTPDALAEREVASALLEHVVPDGSEGVIVDGLLGTGATGAPHGAIADAIGRIDFWRTAGPDATSPVRVVALDVPSGVDATTGETSGAFVRADLTITFGSLKRGLLVRRELCGTIVVLDIGIDTFMQHAAAPPLVDATLALGAVPPIAAGAHKGDRKRLLVVGGASGMAGATVLAARSAMRSGIGMVRLCVAPQSVVAVQSAEAAAMAASWPARDEDFAALTGWAHVALIGPGIGSGADARALVERLLAHWNGPVVLDADGLNAFAGRVPELGALLGGRPSVLTPHVVEFGRLAGISPAAVEGRRFDIAAELARATGATVLLKGVPTIISDGRSTAVCASGTAVLAVAGSGDVLGGIVATLLAQTGDPLTSASTAAWVHGRAAELAGAGHVRGVTLDDVLESLPRAWRAPALLVPPVLAELRSAAG